MVVNIIILKQLSEYLEKQEGGNWPKILAVKDTISATYTSTLICI